jgi:periplasmic protein TonB
MFDLIAGREKHLPSHASVPLLLSTSAQATVIALIFVLPLLFMTERLPEVPTMMAFVADVPAPPPPPPPAAAAKPKQATPKPAAAAQQNQVIAPLEAPAEIAALPDDEGSDTGVPGGVEGGIPGGVPSGVVGGLPEAPPPPPPAPAPTPRTPVRIGGQIKQPQLLKRVEPDYPLLAVTAHIQGIVILEATVSEDGAVTEVRLLRSANPLLDREAERALRQWRYSPLDLNGTHVPFVLTVTLSFFLEAPK